MKRGELETQLMAYSLPARQNPSGAWEKEYCLPDNFVGFAGHFPRRPVLPALVQLVMIRLLVEEMGKSAYVLDVPGAKFASPILPGEHVLVSVAAQEAVAATRDGVSPRLDARVAVLEEGRDSPRLAAKLTVEPWRA